MHVKFTLNGPHSSCARVLCGSSCIGCCLQRDSLVFCCCVMGAWSTQPSAWYQNMTEHGFVHCPLLAHPSANEPRCCCLMLLLLLVDDSTPQVLCICFLLPGQCLAASPTSPQKQVCVGCLVGPTAAASKTQTAAACRVHKAHH